MLITTRNSVYKLVQDGDKVVATKIKELVEGLLPVVKVGDVAKASSVSPVVIGKSFCISDLWTSTVTRIESEPGDEAICFR